LWQYFCLTKQYLKKKNNGNENEVMLFHGSRNNAYQTILDGGFDVRVANLGGSIGAGIYFAPQSATSRSYVLANNQNMQMLYCRVLLGEMGQGQGGIRRPPNKPNGSLFDSVGVPNNMYVIFDNTQVYPEYLISFNASNQGYTFNVHQGAYKKVDK